MRVFPSVSIRKIMQFVTYHRKEKTQPARTLIEPLFEILPSGIYVEFTVICLFAGISLCHQFCGIFLEFYAVGASLVQVCGIHMTVFAGHDLDLIFFHIILLSFLLFCLSFYYLTLFDIEDLTVRTFIEGYIHITAGDEHLHIVYL